MKLATVNIGRGLGPNKVEDDMEEILRVLGNPFIGWQEIDEADTPDEHAILERVFKKFTNVHMDQKNPITVPKGYKVVRTRKIFGAAGIPHVSPNKWITEVLVRKKWTRKKFVILNVHFPPDAFNKKTEKHQHQVEVAWRSVFEALRERMTFWHTLGVTTFRTGDDNRMAMPKIIPQEERLIHGGIDNISYVEGMLLVEVIEMGTIDLNSDHSAKWVKFALS